MGFTGGPGGPDWYINTMDNTKPHGPGGQFQHDLSEQADSCSAKIVDGQDTLDRIFPGEIYPRNSEYAFFCTESVEIVSARIQEPVQEAVVQKSNKLPKGSSATQQKKAHAQETTVLPSIKTPRIPTKATNSGAAKVAAARAASVKTASVKAANNKKQLDIEKMKQQAVRAAGAGIVVNKATPGDNNPPSP